ncbi:MAG: type II secretion system F family protein [Dehalococcoidia bacterium]
MQFTYVAYTTGQGVLKGKVDAPDRDEASAFVTAQGYKVIKLQAVRQKPGLEILFPSLFKAGPKDVVHFARQIASMLASGGSLMRALELAQSEAKSRLMRRVVAAMRDRLAGGGSLTDAMKEHPKVFDRLFVSVVEVGEHTGRVGPSLDQLADMIEHDVETKQKAIKTMMYPMAIMGMSLVTLGVLITFAVPPLMNTFAQMGAEIPLMTRIAVEAVGFVTGNFVTGAIVLVALVVGFSLLKRLPSTRLYVDGFAIKAPLIGPLVVAGDLSRFSRTMAMLLGAGVSVSDTIKMAIEGCNNSRIRGAMVAAEASLYAGHGLTAELRKHKALPSFFVELVMMGEEGNQLPRMMNDAATTYQKEKDARLGAVLAALEPLSTLLVGGIVGFIAFAMFLPIYTGLGALG